MTVEPRAAVVNCWRCWTPHHQAHGLALSGGCVVAICAACLPIMRHTVHLWHDGSRFVSMNLRVVK